MKFGMFFLGEYINMFTVSALATTLFMGGWHAPWPLNLVGDGMLDQGWWGLLWFTLKMWAFIFFYVWVRGSLPRVRYDQFMALGWKILIPLSLVWVVAVMLIRSAQEGYFGEGRWVTVLTLGGIGVFVLIGILVWDRYAQRRAAAKEEAREVPEEIDPFADGYPVPPMPGQRLVEPRPAVEQAAPVTVPAGAPPTDTDDARTSPTDEKESRG